MIFKSNSVEDTNQLAAKIAEKVKDSGGVIALSGDLGAGKTTFTQGFAKALGIDEKIISPTFVIMRQHQVPNSSKVLYHIDLYRLGDETNLNEVGIAELFSNPDNLIIIEWAEKAKSQLPENTIWINFRRENDERTIEISNLDI